MSDDKLATRDAAELMHSPRPLGVVEVTSLVGRVQGIKKEIMIEDVHFGKIPGCGDKPALLKPGAELLSMAFRLLPKYEITTTDLGNGHREYTIITTLLGPDGDFRGQGVGSCSTMEKKFRYRDTEKKCPSCGLNTVRKGKKDYGGGWYCSAKDGGCGTKWKDGDESIEGQPSGKIENPDIADVYNTCLKQGKKRSLVDGTLTATASSDMFTQDIDDNPEAFTRPQHPAPPPAPAKPKAEPPKRETQPAAPTTLAPPKDADFMDMIVDPNTGEVI